MAIAVLVLTASGQTWLSRYNGPANDEDQAWGIAVNGAGQVCVTGSSWNSGTSNDLLTIAYGPAGESLWAVRFDGPAHGDDQARAIVAHGGDVFVTGGSADASLMTDILTIGYDTAGNQRWAALYNGANNGNDHGLAVTTDDAGYVYTAGYSAGDTTGWDLAAVKYDAAGAEQWASIYSTVDEDYAVGAAADAGGHVYVTGNSGSPYTLNWDYVTIKYDASTGDTLWARRFNGPADDDDEARAIALDHDGNVIVTGGTTSSGSGVDFTTIKYRPDGETLWVRRYNGSANGPDWANALAVDDAGNAYVTGSSQDTATDMDYATVKYDPNGNQVWAARYDGPSHSFDEARAIVVDGTGNVYVTGGSIGSGTRSDYATVKYDASGGEMWVNRYDGPTSRLDEAVAVALDPTGGVCVTGGSAGSGTGTDYATVRYPFVGISESGAGNRVVPTGLACVGANPFRTTTAVRFVIEARSHASVTLCDVAGRTVATLVDRETEPGTYSVAVSACDCGQARGVYFVTLSVRPESGAARRAVAKLVLAD
jgi:hypothetical protein